MKQIEIFDCDHTYFKMKAVQKGKKISEIVAEAQVLHEEKEEALARSNL